MAVYKVAQDVEAEDKLIGPFSFRQFIYLIIVAISIVLAWGLAQLFVGLAIIPLPLILFFGALALPLRKDQPMEIYMAAIVSYYLKPRKRLWIPDGIESLIEITVPKQIEIKRTKDISQSEAEQRFSYLADIADTGGWAIRHTAQPFDAGSSMNNDVFWDAQKTEDILDDTGNIAQSIDTMINKSDERRKQEMMQRMRAPAAPATKPDPQQWVQPQATGSSYSQPMAPQPVFPTQPQQAASTTDPSVNFNPYPSQIHQMVINPLGQTPTAVPARDEPATTEQKETPPSTSEKPLSPDIINLASNSDLSIETIQREADRISKKHTEDNGDEVVISLR